MAISLHDKRVFAIFSLHMHRNSYLGASFKNPVICSHSLDFLFIAVFCQVIVTFVAILRDDRMLSHGSWGLQKTQCWAGNQTAVSCVVQDVHMCAMSSLCSVYFTLPATMRLPSTTLLTNAHRLGVSRLVKSRYYRHSGRIIQIHSSAPERFRNWYSSKWRHRNATGVDDDNRVWISNFSAN